jgi:predicted kinase
LDWICPGCGDISRHDLAAAAGRAPHCLRCQHERLYKRLPLLVVTGPSGAGKSTIAADLAATPDVPDAVYLDSDTLLIKGLTDRGWDEYRDGWVWTCVNIAQSGRPVVLFGAGDPIEFARASRIEYFSSTHYLALTCDEDELRRRLIARPASRKSADPAFIQAMVDWNARLTAGRDPNGVTWDVLNTSENLPAATAREVARWVGRHWAGDAPVMP